MIGGALASVARRIYGIIEVEFLLRDEFITDEAVVSAGTTFTHEADCLIEFEATTLPGWGSVTVNFRTQDSNNFWRVELSTAGNLVLAEIVGGGGTTRGTAAAVLSGGERIVVICDDETITGYYDNTQAWSYSSAANFKTETDGKIGGLAGAGAISNLITWPRTLSGEALTELEKYTQ